MRKEFCSTIAAVPHSWPAGAQPSCGPAALPSSKKPAWLNRGALTEGTCPQPPSQEPTVPFHSRVYAFIKLLCPVSLSLSLFLSVSFSLPNSYLLNQSYGFHVSILVCWIHPAVLGFKWKTSSFYFLEDLILLKRWGLHTDALSSWERARGRQRDTERERPFQDQHFNLSFLIAI